MTTEVEKKTDGRGWKRWDYRSLDKRNERRRYRRDNIGCMMKCES